MKGEIQILPAALRGKKRYIAFEVISEEKIDFSEIVGAVWHSLMNFLGELGTSRSNIWIMKDNWDEDTQRGLIKCSHKEVEYIRASLSLITIIGENNVIIRTLGVSGTIKGAKKKFFGERDLTDF